MTKYIKTRKGNDGFYYPYTSPDLVVDEDGKSTTTKFSEINTQLENIGQSTQEQINTAIDKAIEEGKMHSDASKLSIIDENNNFMSDNVEGALEELNTQCKDIANRIDGIIITGGGLTTEQITALDNMFKVCAYIKNDISTEYNNFRTAFKIGLKNYTITNNLTNCTSNNSTVSVQEGSSYSATITPNSNYILQAPIITMGGTDVTSSVYSNGVISIANVTGNIVITCNAIEQTANSYTITNNLTNCTTNNVNTSIIENSSYSATLTADSAYNLGQITVTMGGADITSTAVSGSSISITNVTGNIVITCTSTLVTYTVTNNLTNCTSNNSSASINKNSSYTATITPSDGYALDTVTITMGGTDITSTAYSNGNINISKVTGNIVITISSVKETTAELLSDVCTLVKANAIANGNWNKDNSQYSLNVKTGDKITIKTQRWSYQNDQCYTFVWDGTTDKNTDIYKEYCVLNDDGSVTFTAPMDYTPLYVSFKPGDTISNIVRANS